MKRLVLKISPETPLLISRTAASGNHLDSYDHIPGGNLLGILAGRFIEAHSLGKTAHENDDFRRLFLSDKISYWHATLSINARRSHVIPLNIQQLKSSGKQYSNIFDARKSGPLKYKRAYSNGADIDQPRMLTSFHTARSDERLAGRSLKGGIFSYSALAAGQQFLAEIIGSSEDIQLINELILAKPEIRLGRSKTAQYGSAQWEVLNIADITVNKNDLSEQPLTLSLKTPAIIHNEFGQASTLWVDFAQALKNQLGLPDIPQCDQMLVRTTTIESFNRIWGLKRPSEIALDAGCVFQLKSRHGFTAEHIDKLLNQGIGKRRNEGYGEVSVEEIDVHALNTKSTQAVFEKPEGVPPGIFMEIYGDIARREIKNLAERAALKSALQPALPHSLTVSLRDLFKREDSLHEIERSLGLAQTHRQDEKVVDKTRAEHLKRVKLDGQFLFNILEDAPQFHNQILDRIDVTQSDFLQASSKAFSQKLDDFKDIAWKAYWETLLTKHLKGRQS